MGREMALAAMRMPGNGLDVQNASAQCLAASMDVAVEVASSQDGELRAVSSAATLLLVGAGRELASWRDMMQKNLGELTQADFQVRA